tara:strand:- start:98 stop:916 length:819 start_codon:yes stop_codon:yes gene_type:complete
MTIRATDPWLVALDVDGTLLHEDGHLSDRVVESVRGAWKSGHQVMLATGRSVSMTLPILKRLEIEPEFVVCSNGAVTIQRDSSYEGGYRRFHIERFNSTEVLRQIKAKLPQAHYAVEDEKGVYRYTDWFPSKTLDSKSQQVSFEELLNTSATRVVVISPDHDISDFLAVVEGLGLHQINYTVGWTAWLDIAPDGVNKATAMERVRKELDFPMSRVMVVGDGRNDIEMLQWAALRGRAVAMGQAPEEVQRHATEVTSGFLEDGVARVLELMSG